MIRLGWIVILLCGCTASTPPHEGKSVEQLRRMLQQDDPTVQAQAALGLSLHGDAAAEAVPRLRELLTSPHPLVRRHSALALGKIGPQAASAVPELLKLLKHEDWATRRQAILALVSIGDPATRSAIEPLCRDSNSLVAGAAKEALQRLPSESPR